MIYEHFNNKVNYLKTLLKITLKIHLKIYFKRKHFAKQEINFKTKQVQTKEKHFLNSYLDLEDKLKNK